MIFYIIGGVILAVLLLCLIAAFVINALVFGKRCDQKSYMRYFTEKDYPSLSATDVSFPSKGVTLRGRFYSYPNPQKKLLVLAHGMYSGHVAYTQEIEYFARRGYVVFAYDATGSFASGGKSLVAFSRATLDLDYALRYVEGLEEYRGAPIYLFGHSWGGYAVSNVIALHPEVTGLVAMSGPSSLWTLFYGICAPALRFLVPFCVFVEWCKTGRYALFDRVKIWQKVSVPKMVIHGTEDPLIDYNRNVLPIQSMATVLSVPRRHNPDYTEDAETYGAYLFAELQKAEDKDAFAETADFARAGALNEDVLDKAVAFYESIGN